ncbi:hypothetical protein TrRE_jg6046 [Triparma retinervis]|uniref:Uncharacterized protein n=1 Tax=Triparma retinervis TaxID=2557542 RepID=A0A9W7FB10_9STRA|nr:hypothetical protein TrRE_jg6046 [Triparma retinervis]
MMEGGGVLAKAGETLVTITESIPFECYGGALSAAGASLRNAGDCLSQSGANARNKFAAEMCADECREGAVCLEECSVKFTAFIAEEMEYVPLNLPPSLPKSLAGASKNAEMAGRVMFSQGMKGGKGKQDDIDREALGRFLEGVSVNLKEVHAALKTQEVDCEDWPVMCGHFEKAAEKFLLSSNEIRGIAPAKPSGRSFMKGS